MADDNTNLVLELEIIAKPNIKLDAQGFEGRESISQLFQFVVFATTSSDAKIASLIGERVKLSVTTPAGKLLICGLLAEIEEMDQTATDQRVLQFLIRPRFSVTELAIENRVFGPGEALSADDIVKDEMKRVPINVPVEYNLGAYPKRNYVVQFDESDFSFISRICERDGIFYYFKQEDGGEKLVFGDQNIAFPKVSFGSRPSITYLPPHDQNVGRSAEEPVVLSFRQRRTITTKSVKLRDYNEAIPAVVSGSGNAGEGNEFLGAIERFGTYLKDDGGGARLAKLRAEQIAVKQTTFLADSDAPQLRAGTIFQLTNHASLDGEYLVVSASHSAYRPAPAGFQALPRQGRAYRNAVECIRSSVPFRPPMVTPRPTSVGLHTAWVDGESWNGRAEIDREGRYKVQFNFSDSESDRARGSDYIRKTEPYVGPSETGLHFPLVAGTEVIVGYLNGDIDRPIVLGAVSNPNMRHVVTADSHTHNRIKSQSGSMVEIFDGGP